MHHLRHQRIFSWIAILAMLLNTFMPLVAQAVDLEYGKRSAQSIPAKVASDGSSWQELCSTSGSVWIKVAADGAVLERSSKKPAEAPATIHLEHCSYCVTHAGSFGLLPSEHVLGFESSTLSTTGRISSTPFITHTAWMIPAVRAPPSFVSL